VKYFHINGIGGNGAAKTAARRAPSINLHAGVCISSKVHQLDWRETRTRVYFNRHQIRFKIQEGLLLTISINSFLLFQIELKKVAL
jgi:hypothetical protein